MNAYAKIIIRQDFKKKDGSCPIYLRVTINRKLKYVSLKISAHQDQWDDEKFLFKKSAPNSHRNNLIIKNAINKADKIIFDFTLQNKPLSVGEFERIFNVPEIRGNSFYEFVEKTIKELESKFSFFTIKTLKSHFEKLKKFSAEVCFEDLTLSFIKAYDIYMIGLNNCENTRFKAMGVLKSFINKAIKEGYMNENPFRHYPIRKKSGNREFLTIEELKTLEELYHQEISKNLKNTLKYFLFACYTGLRYQDVKKLQFSEIIGDMITLKVHKTKEMIKIPLIEKSKHLIESGFNNQKVFRVTANQVTNRNLKEIIKLTSIKKDISFHSARHTFATIGITLGIPIEVISKLLGHKDLHTTQIYAKIVDDVKIKEMDKWNSLN